MDKKAINSLVINDSTPELDIIVINGSNKVGKDFFIRLFEACANRRESSIFIRNISSIEPYRWKFSELFAGEEYIGTDAQRKALNDLKRLAVAYGPWNVILIV